MLHEFTYVEPGTMQDLLQFLSEKGAQAAVLSGGTDLMVNIRAGIQTPEYVVDLKRIPELAEISYDGEIGLSIGATVTVNGLIDFEPAQKAYAILIVAGRELATFQLRNRATVIGNVVTASPCGDMTSPLLCLDAVVELVSLSGTRAMPLREFITGVKQTQIRPDEIVRRIIVPPTFAGAVGGYEKLKRIKGHDLGVVAVALIRAGDILRVSISSAAPTPVLLPDFPAGTAVEDIQKAAQEMISPIDDVRCTAEYRSFMVNVYIRRLCDGLDRVRGAA